MPDKRALRTCAICRQTEDPGRADATAVMSRLVGHVAFAICIRCGLEVPDRRDPEYIARAKRYLGAIES